MVYDSATSRPTGVSGVFHCYSSDALQGSGKDGDRKAAELIEDVKIVIEILTFDGISVGVEGVETTSSREHIFRGGRQERGRRT